MVLGWLILQIYKLHFNYVTDLNAKSLFIK